MGYDILGTFSREQWNTLRNFFRATLQTFEEKYRETDERSIYLKHLLAEIAKAQIEFDHLERALANFSDFKGDFPVKKELQVSAPKSLPVRFRLSDIDTAYTVSLMKSPIRQVIKRQKDNLEYRFKKIFDLIDQLENKFNIHSNYREIFEANVGIIEVQFTDGFHTHNLREDEVFNQDGFIDHGLDGTNMDREQEDRWLSDQSPDRKYYT